MIENWAESGMPPEEYDVINKQIISFPDSKSETVYIWIKGEHPHKGTVINGFSGKETFVEIYNYPGIKPRIIKNQYNVAEDHPLYSIIQEKFDKKSK
jgi:hypothetical protein